MATRFKAVPLPVLCSLSLSPAVFSSGTEAVAYIIYLFSLLLGPPKYKDSLMRTGLCLSGSLMYFSV